MPFKNEIGLNIKKALDEGYIESKPWGIDLTQNLQSGVNGLRTNLFLGKQPNARCEISKSIKNLLAKANINSDGTIGLNTTKTFDSYKGLSISLLSTFKTGKQSLNQNKYSAEIKYNNPLLSNNTIIDLANREYKSITTNRSDFNGIKLISSILVDGNIKEKNKINAIGMSSIIPLGINIIELSGVAQNYNFGKFQNYSFGLNTIQQNSTILAMRYKYISSRNDSKLEIGIQKKVDDSTILGMKVDNNYIISCNIKKIINPDISVGIASSVS